ncbi:hypothetical protein ANN_21631 [Periplaneta americana]|uniref:Uncharacterized protein n=1 Tax=Periplaneta americana TaxID=6978 RepID=A0ABQ8S5Z2_PERAM|nr:hypothetical protein ANN_21631 [Periplaneta americana]
MDLREVGYDCRDWINLAQDRDKTNCAKLQPAPPGQLEASARDEIPLSWEPIKRSRWGRWIRAKAIVSDHTYSRRYELYKNSSVSFCGHFRPVVTATWVRRNTVENCKATAKKKKACRDKSRDIFLHLFGRCGRASRWADGAAFLACRCHRPRALRGAGNGLFARTPRMNVPVTNELAGNNERGLSAMAVWRCCRMVDCARKLLTVFLSGFEHARAAAHRGQSSVPNFWTGGYSRERRGEERRRENREEGGRGGEERTEKREGEEGRGGEEMREEERRDEKRGEGRREERRGQERRGVDRRGEDNEEERRGE